MTPQFDEILNAFKQDERPETVLTIAGDSTAARLMVGRASVRVRRRRSPGRLRGQDGSARWEWAWQNVSYSLKELAVRAGMSLGDTRHKMAELIGNRVIYPDGTLNRFAQRYLRKTVLDLFDAKPVGNRRHQAELAQATT